MAMHTYSSLVGPLLAGFSLAAIVTLATNTSAPPMGEWAILAFALAVVFLLFAMQFSLVGGQYATSPADRLAWRPEATVDRDALENERWYQALDTKLASIYFNRSAVLFELGLLAFLAGLALSVIPDRWTAPREVSLLVTVLAGLVEVWWALARWRARLRGPLLPGYGSVEPTISVSDLDAIGIRSVIAQQDS